ncbi:MAG TPA: triose-phosphate isomerase [Casimicrobiaceae bacterium]|nr:triose-phosphate isomerase [Casimicrobiaceae bacterium]
MRGKLVVGNWKMNGSLTANSALLVALLADWKPGVGRRIGVCVPFPYLGQVRDALAQSEILWGAQDVSAHASGAFTGEVSAGMLSEFGCRMVLVGHSERRQLHAETDDEVAKKTAAALDRGLTPIVCLGETLAEREAGQTQNVVGRQFDAVAAKIGPRMSLVVVAYEPVWAIGTGKTATPGEAQEVHGFLRHRLASAGAEGVQVLYGGSVKAANAAELFAMPDIDGGLVGGASLNADEFLAIAAA